MKNWIIALMAAVALALPACAPQLTPEQAVEEATLAASDGDYERATGIITELLERSDTASMTVSQYCRMGTVFALAADHDVCNDVNMAAAVRCIDRALAVNADSTHLYIEAMPLESRSVLMTVLQLAGAAGEDFSDFEDPEYPDSVYDDHHHGHEEF